MTREEAIDYFKRSVAEGNTDDERQHNEALDMAIKALEFQKKVKETCDYPYVVMETKYCYICSLVRRFDNEQETNTD